MLASRVYDTEVFDFEAASAGTTVVVKKSAVRVIAINFTISSKWSLLFVKSDSKVSEDSTISKIL